MSDIQHIKTVDKLGKSNLFATLTVVALLAINSAVQIFMAAQQELRFNITQNVIEQRESLQKMARNAEYLFQQVKRAEMQPYLFSQVQSGIKTSLVQLNQRREQLDEYLQHSFLVNKKQNYYYLFEPPYSLNSRIDNFQQQISILAETPQQQLLERYERWNLVYLVVSQESTLMRGMNEYQNAILKDSDKYLDLMKLVQLLFNLGIVATLIMQTRFIFLPIQRKLKQEQTELNQSKKQMQQLATFDQLTKLANRYELERRVDHLINGFIERLPFTLLVIDLDNFKPVNDNYGHAVGDIVLIEIAKRMKNNMRSTDFVARMGGDEFVVCLKNVDNEHHIQHTLNKLKQAINQPLLIEQPKVEVTLGASIGYASYPAHGQSLAQLFKHADAAMYQDKAKQSYETR